MIINHNMNAMNAHRMMGMNTVNSGKSMEKLSSGLRINRAGDDAAGLAISEKMRGQIRGLDQAARNGQDGISMIQTAEGALNETHSILQRMRELSVQASNDTNISGDRNEIQKELNQLNSEIDRISQTTEFNTQKLLNGSLGSKGSSSDATKVAVVSTSGLKAVVPGVTDSGTYDVKITTAAAKASLEGNANANDVNVAKATGEELVINGVKIDTTNVKNTADLKTAINAVKDKTGVEMTAGADGSAKIKLEATEEGSSKKISLAGSDAKWLESDILGGSTAGTAAATTAGVDAIVDITDKTAKTTTTVTGVGQKVLYDNAEFTAKGVANDTATITVTTSGASMHIGANQDQTMLIDMNEMSTKTLGDSTNGNYLKDINVLTNGGAEKAITTVDEAIKQVSGERSKLGAFQNRLEHTINNLGTSSENLTAAESRIRDVDMAKEMMNFSKNNILSQAAQAMLAQANQQPQGVLQLLR
ncbi:flagellin N-terminal helical domain-containing protein [Clostridium weizhouense]|uniref:Flagellin n=1 Tax=Clostridium weizhouense TaxID=2859781 RepID=A0ABS7ASB1_9CLOT|nr:flagellin [Clostridium weizhouense]MBW6411560.1 flagellin [Clostridium weizhouense]